MVSKNNPEAIVQIRLHVLIRLLYLLRKIRGVIQQINYVFEIVTHSCVIMTPTIESCKFIG